MSGKPEPHEIAASLRILRFPPGHAGHRCKCFSIKELVKSPVSWYKKRVKTIHAIYESGVFRPLERVELPDRTEVEFEPHLVAPSAGNAAGLDAVYAILGERYESGESDIAARHNEHQP